MFDSTPDIAKEFNFLSFLSWGAEKRFIHIRGISGRAYLTIGLFLFMGLPRVQIELRSIRRSVGMRITTAHTGVCDTLLWASYLTRKLGRDSKSLPSVLIIL